MPTETVRLMHYDPRWRQEFQQTRSSILMCCEGWVTDAQHIGSTAISGLIARPTIDVIATVQAAEGMEAAAMLIEGLNFRREQSPDWAAGAITLIKPRNIHPDVPEPTHRILLALEASSILKRTIGIRDHFRGHPEVAMDWEESKVASWRNCEGDVTRYESDKAGFFADLEDQLGVTRD